MVKKVLKTLITLIIIVAVLVIAYFAYALLNYNRIEDYQSLDVNGEAAKSSLTTEENYRIVSSNLGFGAYSDDFSFFMDGGTESWAYSKEAVNQNINGSLDAILSLNPDIIVCQEIDIDSTRSYHIDEREIIYDRLDKSSFGNWCSTFAQNYDSPFLILPFKQPHGIARAGLMAISSAQINEATRRSLPIEEGITKLIDLDRCYSKNVIDVDNGKQLILYNVHLSAYTTDPSTAENQVKLLNEDMRGEFAAGNYIVVGGDMNKDVLGDSTKYFNTSAKDQLWAVAFPEDLLESDFSVVKPVDEENPIASCRNADGPYNEDSFVITVDGFIVSSNIEVVDASVLDTGFKYSDHNPVYMDFILK